MSKNKTQSAEMLDLGEIFEIAINAPFEYRPKGTDKVFQVNQQVFVERITPDLLDAITEATEKSEAEALQQIINNTVKNWNIQLKGKQLGTDLATLKQLPMSFLKASGEAIIALLQGRPTNEPNSLNTSVQVESAAQSPDSI
jgi:hypothetical protein